MRHPLDRYLEWVRDVELDARPGSDHVVAELRAVADRIVASSGSLEGRRVLDLGSGTGLLAIAAASAGAGAVAVDVSPGALQRGSPWMSGLPIRAVAGDARALPFANGSFDISIHRSVLVYMEERSRAVDEERRMLIPGGIVSCSESLGSEIDLDASEPGLIRAWHGGLREILEQTAADSFTFSADRLRALYADAGFEQVRVESESRRLPLDSGAAVARAFAATPPAGRSARDRWLEAGVPEEFANEFLARLTLEADEGRPAHLIVQEGFLTAVAPG
jgi:ubiquinone/menaquinone biosynthesis C-methylase UbiE